MPSKSPVLKLPTLAAFKALPLRKRTLLFKRWVISQPARKTYMPGDVRACALCQFGKALDIVDPISDAATVRNEHDESSRVRVLSESNEIIFAPQACYGDPSTFGALAKRLTIHLKRDRA